MTQLINTFRVTSAYKLQHENSLYSANKIQYARFDHFLDLYEALILTMPYEQAEVPYFSEISRDLFFKLTIADDDLMEVPMLQMIYITRTQLMKLICKSASFQALQKKVQFDEKQAFIFSIFLLSTLAQWHQTLHFDKVLLEDMNTIMYNNHFDLRPLFSEDFSMIEPYPKKIVDLQQKQANIYSLAVKSNRLAFEDAIQLAYNHMLIFTTIQQDFSVSMIGGELHDT